MSKLFDGRRILVTGGTGSLGQVLARRLMSGSDGVPESVTVFSRDEAKRHQMRLHFMHRHAATDEVIFENSKQRLKFMIDRLLDSARFRAATGWSPPNGDTMLDELAAECTRHGCEA